ncbi:MAG: sulfatase [Verrucomicrobiota bacterium]
MKKFLCLIAIGLSISSAICADESSRPNIVFILVDDLRWDALSCMGHAVAKTPNIDRIAKEGALFKNFFVTLPLCSPSRASFLTGQYAHRHGIIDNSNRNELIHKLVTFPKLLHDGGYETAYIGKLHMGNDDSPRPGFDRWVSFKGQGVYNDPMINFDGKAEKVPGYITDILNSNAVAFVKKDHEKPFVLCLAHKAVHGPFTAAERYKNLYPDAKFAIPPGINDPLKDKPLLTREISEETAPSKKALFPQENAGNKNKAVPNRFAEKTALAQLRCLAAVDDGVGQIFSALEQTKQLKNTVVIFSSDNGYFWGEHGLGDKRWAYEESIRDPLLIRYPKLIKAGTTYDEMVLNIDIAPTLLELGGASIPKNIQGRSLVPLWKGDTDWRHAAFLEYFQEKQYSRVPSWQAIRTDRWKLIRYPDLDGMEELYDLKVDPFEIKNLIKDAAAARQVEELRRQLEKLAKEN